MNFRLVFFLLQFATIFARSFHGIFHGIKYICFRARYNSSERINERMVGACSVKPLISFNQFWYEDCVLLVFYDGLRRTSCASENKTQNRNSTIQRKAFISKNKIWTNNNNYDIGNAYGIKTITAGLVEKSKLLNDCEDQPVRDEVKFLSFLDFM